MTKRPANGIAVPLIGLYAAIVVLGIGGWIANIVKMINAGFDPITGLVVARVIGVFVAPLGSVLGFL